MYTNFNYILDKIKMHDVIDRARNICVPTFTCYYIVETIFRVLFTSAVTQFMSR